MSTFVEILRGVQAISEQWSRSVGQRCSRSGWRECSDGGADGPPRHHAQLRRSSGPLRPQYGTGSGASGPRSRLHRANSRGSL